MLKSILRKCISVYAQEVAQSLGDWHRYQHKGGPAMKWLSKRRAATISSVAIAAALGMVSIPAWAESLGKTSADATSHAFAAAGVTGARVLRDDEMGDVRGGFLGGLLGILDTLPETNTVSVQDGDNTVSASGPGLQSRTISRPGFTGTATANSGSASTTSYSRIISSSTRR